MQIGAVRTGVVSTLNLQVGFRVKGCYWQIKETGAVATSRDGMA